MSALLGFRIRERRRELGLTQTALAERVGVSPSYLNLIEHNKRRIGGKLLAEIGKALSLSIDSLDGAAERRLRARMIALAADPDLGDPDVDPESADELIARFPAWSRTAARAHARCETTREELRMMSDRLANDPVLSDAVHAMLTEITALRSTAEILASAEDMSAAQRSRFEHNVHQQAVRLSDTGAALARYFDDAVEARRPRTPESEAEELLARRLDAADAIEDAARTAGAAASFETEDAEGLRLDRLDLTAIGRQADEDPRRFSRAARRALAADEAARGLLSGPLEALTERFASDADDGTRMRLRDELRQRLADALRAPADAFAAVGARLRWRLEALAAFYDDDAGLVARRLAALHGFSSFAEDRPPKAAHVELDASGGVLTRRGALGLLPQPRSLACPGWPAYAPRLAVEGRAAGAVATAEGETLIGVAFQRSRGGCELIVLDAAGGRDTAYGELLDGSAAPVGPDCRLCAHRACAARRTGALVGA